jgi:hypothetical protein
VDSNPCPPVTVRVIAAVPLLRGGLKRAASCAGLTVVTDEEASITLRSSDQHPAASRIDVASTLDSVTVTVRDLPDVRTWLGVLALLRQLLDDGAR